MEQEILLWLEQMPLKKNGEPGIQGIKEYTWHTFSSFDEAFLTLYTTKLNELNQQTAINNENDYFLNAGRIYNERKAPPSVTIESYDSKMEHIPWFKKFAGDRIYAVEASLQAASEPVLKMFAPYLDENRFGEIPIAEYSAKTKTIKHANGELQSTARSYLHDHFKLSNSFDYVKIEWLQGEAILYPRAATVTSIKRYRDFIPALRELLEDHIAPTGRMPELNPDRTEEFSCILHASDSRPVADLMMVFPQSPLRPMHEIGLYLHFEDDKFLREAMIKYNELQLLARKPGNVFPLALSPSDGNYWDFVALKSTAEFIRMINKKQRLSPGKNKRIMNQIERRNGYKR